MVEYHFVANSVRALRSVELGSTYTRCLNMARGEKSYTINTEKRRGSMNSITISKLHTKLMLPQKVIDCSELLVKGKIYPKWIMSYLIG